MYADRKPLQDGYSLVSPPYVSGRRSRIELPDVAHLANLVEVELGGDQLRLVARRLRHELPARVAEVTLAVELADVPRLLRSPTRLIAPTKYAFATACAGCSSFHRYSDKSRHGRRRIEHDLRAVQVRARARPRGNGGRSRCRRRRPRTSS